MEYRDWSTLLGIGITQPIQSLRQAGKAINWVSNYTAAWNSLEEISKANGRAVGAYVFGDDKHSGKGN